MELSEQAWRGVARQLVASGLLAVDHDAYGAFKLTEASRAVLKGEQTVSLRKQTLKGRPAKKKRLATFDGLSGAEAGLYERLRAWRADAARAHGVPAYVILHDATLRDIAHVRPGSLEALRMISGFGARKIEAYGAEILKRVTDET
jgi:ATP-dependent DNA helicase RecQ